MRQKLQKYEKKFSELSPAEKEKGILEDIKFKFNEEDEEILYKTPQRQNKAVVLGESPNTKPKILSHQEMEAAQG